MNLSLRMGDLVKIDLGAHVDGYIADSAVSVFIGVRSKDSDIENNKEQI